MREFSHTATFASNPHGRTHVQTWVHGLLFCFLLGMQPTRANATDGQNRPNLLDLFANIESHPSVQALQQEALSLANEGESSSRWDEPRMTVVAKQRGVPIGGSISDPLRFLDVSIAQNIPLSNRLDAKGDSARKMSQSLLSLANQAKRELAQLAWYRLIEREALNRELSVLRLNLSWLEKRISFTSAQFQTGQASQQALLELKVLESELERRLASIPLRIAPLESDIRYVLELDDDTEIPDFVPWRPRSSPPTKTPAILAAEYRETSARAALLSAEASRIPDITLQLGYSAAMQDERNADMLSLGLSLPLPVQGRRSQFAESKADILASSSQSLENIIKQTESRKIETEEEIRRLESELRTLESETLEFARSARKIAERSYSLGQSSYVELLNAEGTLRRIELEQIDLWQKLEKKRIEHLFWKGAPLWK